MMRVIPQGGVPVGAIAYVQVTPLEVGVRAAIDWYKENGITQTFTHLKEAAAADAKA